jgi:hypothetical protein
VVIKDIILAEIHEAMDDDKPYSIFAESMFAELLNTELTCPK